MHLFVNFFNSFLYILWYQVLSNTNNFQTDLFDPYMGPQLIPPPWVSEPWSNSNTGILHTVQNSRTGASPSDAVLCHTQGKILSWRILFCLLKEKLSL